MNHMKLANLPPGWTFSIPFDGVFAVTRGEGYVSISFDRRSFAPGRANVYTSELQKYVGRGWRQRLVDDAIAYLEGL